MKGSSLWMPAGPSERLALGLLFLHPENVRRLIPCAWILDVLVLLPGPSVSGAELRVSVCVLPALPCRATAKAPGPSLALQWPAAAPLHSWTSSDLPSPQCPYPE